MIAIDTHVSPMAGISDELGEAQHLAHRGSAQPEMFEYFKNILDQNLILNTFYWEIDESDPANSVYQAKFMIRYYSIDQASAEIFLEKLMSTTAEFSIYKMYTAANINFSAELKEINFDEESPQYSVIDEATGEIWGEMWPAEF
jgi:hypothetical protein